MNDMSSWLIILTFPRYRYVFRYSVHLPGHTREGATTSSVRNSVGLTGSVAESVLSLDDEKWIFDVL